MQFSKAILTNALAKLPYSVLLNGGHGGAMANFRGGFLKKRHRIAVAWLVWDGGALAVMAVMAEMAEFCLVFVRGRSWADPTQPYPFIH